VLFYIAIVGGAILVKFAIVLQDAVVVVAFLCGLLAVSIGGAVGLPLEAEKLETFEAGRTLEVLTVLLAFDGGADTRVGRCRVVANPAEGADEVLRTFPMGSARGACAATVVTDFGAGTIEASRAALRLRFVAAAGDK